jgi:hydroxymethylglutaryl-CoA reductase (NADPH)
MNLRLAKTPTERRETLERELGVSLKKIGEAETNEDTLIHCENRIGAITIPIGIAGPVRVSGDHISGAHYIPLATTEGALIASVSRGMKATEKGGIITQVEKEGVTRGPVFLTSSLHEARRVEQWIWGHFDELAQVAQSTSGHISLMNADIRHVGMYVFLRLNFDTDRAMGMNMATIATTHIANYIVKKTKAKLQSVAGNFDIDKKPAWMNALLRRGYVVNAETVIARTVVNSVFKTEPRDIYNVWKAKCMIGSALAGSIGFNAHHANIVAAFFAATGQDLAHVVDGSLGMTIVDILDDGSLYGSVYLPDIMLGTVGGGTKLHTQTEARSIMKTDSPFALAELLGAAVLAGELSLLASLSEGTLAKAHSSLGR